MEKEQRFTRDLFPCYESFATHYPERRGEMYRALELAVDPVATQEAEGFAHDFGDWLAREADDRLNEWGVARAP